MKRSLDDHLVPMRGPVFHFNLRVTSSYCYFQDEIESTRELSKLSIWPSGASILYTGELTGVEIDHPSPATLQDFLNQNSRSGSLQEWVPAKGKLPMRLARRFQHVDGRLGIWCSHSGLYSAV